MMNIALTPGKHDLASGGFSAMPWRFVDYWAMTHDPDFSRCRLTPA
jgi:hypothetical protein